MYASAAGGSGNQQVQFGILAALLPGHSGGHPLFNPEPVFSIHDIIWFLLMLNFPFASSIPILRTLMSLLGITPPRASLPSTIKRTRLHSREAEQFTTLLASTCLATICRAKCARALILSPTLICP